MIGRYFSRDAADTDYVAEVDLEFNEKFGMWVRPNTADVMVLRECNRDYPGIDFKDKRILDLGAHIGGFAKLALAGGADKVMCFEPDEFNFELLRLNINDPRSKLFEMAVISGDEKTIMFFLNGSKNSGCSASTIRLKGSVSEKQVRAAKFDKILRSFKPSLIKMDIEGGEFDLLLDYDLPEFVEEVVIEIHGMKKSQRPLMKRLVNKFHEKFRVLHEETKTIFKQPCLVIAHYARDFEDGSKKDQWTEPVICCPNIPKSVENLSETIKLSIDKAIVETVVKEAKEEHVTCDLVTLPKIKNIGSGMTVAEKISHVTVNLGSDITMLKNQSSSLPQRVNDLCYDHFDLKIGADFAYFITKVNERIEWQYGLRDHYDAPDNLPALGPDVEYFGFHLLMDDRMRYIAQNLVAIPDSKLSPPNKICNTLISHFYGARGIHQTITGIEDPREAHVDFERMITDDSYRRELRNRLIVAQEKKIPIYGSTELRTSLFGASNAFITKKYNYPEKNSEPGNILEWVANFIVDGTVDKILKVKSLQGMFKILTAKKGIGNYYGYHGATSNSVNPALPFDHDEHFVVPGPGSSKTARLMFPGLSEKDVKLGDRVIWVRENQNWILPELTIHPFFYNLKDYKGDNIFQEDITELKCYTTEVGMCQYGIFRRLRENPELASRRKVSRIDEVK